jgi:magnesium transporter
VHHIVICQNGKLAENPTLELAEQVKGQPGSLVWLDLEGGLGRAGATLTKLFGISKFTLDNVREEHERARLSKRHGYFYLVVHGMSFDMQTLEAETPKLDVLFAQDFLVTVHAAKLPWLDTLRTSLAEEPDEDNVMMRGVAHLLYSLLDSLVDSYFPVLEDIDDLVDELENVAVRDTSNEVQGRIFSTKRALSHLRRVISPQVEVTNSLVTRTGEVIPSDAEPYFSDVHDHLVRAFEVLDSYRDLMSGLLDVYLTTVSNRLNSVMKQLTILATIFLPITFITGVFGQNFAHSPQVEHDAGLNFWIVLAFMALITVIQLWYFRRRGWLG